MKNGRGIGHGPILPIGAGDSDYLDAQTGCGREDATPQIPRVDEGMAPVLKAARCGEAALTLGGRHGVQGANSQGFTAQFEYRLVAGIPSDPCADPFDRPALSISAWSSWKSPQ